MSEVPNVMPISGLKTIVAARLCNFATSEAFLLRDHTEFLDSKVADALRNNKNAWVEIEGYASARGDADYNQKLSELRISKVRSRIEQYRTVVNFLVYLGHGESESGPDQSDNSGYWRAVEVRVFATKPPPPPPPPNPDAVLFHKFAIKLNNSVSITLPVVEGPQLDMMNFTIADIENKRAAGFRYIGPAGAIPMGPLSLSPISFAGGGPWTVFQMTTLDPKDRVRLKDFDGTANVGQDPGAQLGSVSTPSKLRVSFSSERLRVKGGLSRPSMIGVTTGSGFQMPSAGSFGVGTFTIFGEDSFTDVIIDGKP